MPKQQEIIDAIIERLKGINGTGDYELDFEESVEDSRTRWDQDELPAISVFEMPAEVEEIPNSRRQIVHVLPIQIRAFLEAGSTAAMTAETSRLARADILRAILGTGTRTDNWLAERFPNAAGVGLIMPPRLKRQGPEYSSDSYEITGAVIEIEVPFITDKWSM